MSKGLQGLIKENDREDLPITIGLREMKDLESSRKMLYVFL